MMPGPKHSPLQLPVLDMAQPFSPSSLTSLSQACQDWGFFHITNHCISKDLFSRVYTLSDHLFNLPLETKLQLGPSSPANTYTPHFIASPFFESLRVSGPDYLASAKSSGDVLFKPTNAEFCSAMEEYGNKMMELSKKIIAALLDCLGDGFGVKYYESEFNKCDGYLRINNYTASDALGFKETEGLGMHTDMSCITILYQDETGGLQVRSKEGEWMDIVPSEGTLVVNIGDLLQAWSNGRMRSSEHRVLLKKRARRLSLAFFWCFEDDKVILAPEDVVGEGKQRIYRPFICHEYVKFRQNSEKGRFDKVGYTVDHFAAVRPLETDNCDLGVV